MYQRPEGLSDLMAPQMRCEGYGPAACRQAGTPAPGAGRPAPFLVLCCPKGSGLGHVTPGAFERKRFILLQKSSFLFLLPRCALAPASPLPAPAIELQWAGKHPVPSCSERWLWALGFGPQPANK